MENRSVGNLTIHDADAILSSMEPLGPPVRPWRGIRNTDKHGSGVYGASRADGKRRHIGIDVITVPSDEIISPLDGKVKRLGLAYAGENYRLIDIEGVGKYEGVMVQILYLAPYVTVGQGVRLGQIIGHAQDIAEKYPGIVNHIHFETWRAVNPADVMARMPAPSVDA